MLHEQIKPWVPKLAEFFERATMDNCDELYGELLADLPVTRHAGQVLSIPLLSPGACDFLATLGAEYSPNLAEGEDYRINECVIQPDWALYDQLKTVVRAAVWPIFHLMYGERPNAYASVQLARYGAPGPLGTGWHHDSESEASCVVSLTPERQVGGGTALRPAGAFGPVLELGPLPKGHALLFNGRTTLHRGLPITDGQRNLLVFWMKRVAPE